MAAFPLPDYPLEAVRTGRYHTRDGPIWTAQFPLDPEAWLARRDDLAEREPALRAAFDALGEGRALTFVRRGCEAADTEDRFFVHAYPAGGGGRERLDFWFRDRGIRYGGDCMAQAALPDYGLRSVRTGQYDASGHLWDVGFAPDAEAWLARFEALAASPPALRAKFDLRLDGRTLTLVREACSAADVADRFFVHVYAADGGARENLDFWFGQRGILHGDRCMATVALPEYAVDRIVTGQYDASGHLWEAELAVGDASR